MSLQIAVPGKTFLAGEYLALRGGPTLIFLSHPFFELDVIRGRGQVVAIHPDSPAGQFVRKHKEYFAQFDLHFQDPHSGLGGFGASTAQFLAVYTLWLFKEKPQQDMEKILDFKHLLEAYYEVAWNGQGTRPSGADVIGQIKGSCTFFEKRQGLVQVKSWPFGNLEFFLIHTGNKVATHEHLRTLKEFSTQDLENSFLKIKSSFEISDEEAFVDGITSYAQNLKDLGFTCEPTLRLVADFSNIPGVRAVKGCGALGADIILVITQKNFSKGVKQYCEIHGLKVLAHSSDIAPGLQVQGSL